MQYGSTAGKVEVPQQLRYLLGEVPQHIAKRKGGFMRLFLTLLLVLSGATHAADRDALLDGCASIPDAERRSKCFEAIARMPNQSSIEQPRAEDRAALVTRKYDALNRASIAIRAAVDAGVSYAQYGPYVQQFSIELALARQTADPAEATALDLFDRALEAYRDMATFWDASITFFANRDNRLAFSGLPVRAAGVGWAADKYGMTLQSVDILGLNKGVATGEGMARILGSAHDYVAGANKALLAPAPVAPVAANIPPPVEAPATAPTDHWVGSSVEKVYYHPSCAEASRVPSGSRMVFITARTAEDRGYRRSTSPGC